MKTSGITSIFRLSVGALVTVAISPYACNEEATTAGPTLTIERLRADGDCFVVCTQSAAPAAELGLGKRCPVDSDRDPCAFIGGSDVVRVVADYGPVELDDSVSATPPTLSLVQDGEVVASTVKLTAFHVGARQYSVATLPLPMETVRALGFRAEGSASFSNQIDGFSLTPDVPTLTVSNCAADPSACSLTAGVGQAAIVVTAPALTDPRTASLAVSLDGIPAAAVPITLAMKTSTKVEGSSVLAVPDSPGSTWRFDVSVAGQTLTRQVTLGTATITLTVEQCGPGNDPCRLSRDGGVANVVVTAPVGLREVNGSIISYVDDVTAVTQPLSLSVVGDERRGLVKFAAPAEGASWSFRAIAGRAAGRSQAITLAP